MGSQGPDPCLRLMRPQVQTISETETIMMKTSHKFTGRRAALATLASLAVGVAALPTSALAQAP